jgi:hypothetical protein
MQTNPRSIHLIRVFIAEIKKCADTKQTVYGRTRKGRMRELRDDLGL